MYNMSTKSYVLTKKMTNKFKSKGVYFSVF